MGTVTLKRTFYSTQHAIDLAPLYKHENTIDYSVVVFLLYFCCCHSFSSLTYCNCILWASGIPVTPPCVEHLSLQGNAESVLMLLTMMGMLVTGALQGFRPWLFALWGWLQWFIVALSLVWHCCNCQMCIWVWRAYVIFIELSYSLSFFLRDANYVLSVSFSYSFRMQRNNLMLKQTAVHIITSYLNAQCSFHLIWLYKYLIKCPWCCMCEAWLWGLYYYY